MATAVVVRRCTRCGVPVEGIAHDGRPFSRCPQCRARRQVQARRRARRKGVKPLEDADACRQNCPDPTIEPAPFYFDDRDRDAGGMGVRLAGEALDRYRQLRELRGLGIEGMAALEQLGALQGGEASQHGSDKPASD